LSLFGLGSFSLQRTLAAALEVFHDHLRSVSVQRRAADLARIRNRVRNSEVGHCTLASRLFVFAVKPALEAGDLGEGVADQARRCELSLRGCVS
jgi:hypothetical protein